MFRKTMVKQNEIKKLQSTVEAIDRSQAVISFMPDGTILDANDNFLDTLGYTLDEIRDRHHSMFVDPAYARSNDYASFWSKLARGEFDSAEYQRFGKDGREIWIQATYNPVPDENGKITRVIKFATDITANKQRGADVQGQLAAIDKAQAVIQFNLDGTIITANNNFLGATGYTLDEIQGRHHAMFVDPAYARSNDYTDFWNRLNAGTFDSGQYRRIGKNGREIWIEASYNPILDTGGKPFKVVKYATDITPQRRTMEQILANLVEIDTGMQTAQAQTTSAAQAVGDTTRNMQTVASGAEEMSASVREIAASMAKSSNAVQDVAAQTQAADAATQRLDGAAIAMGGIVEIIQGIAGQINLLALNATIEAARAGEAGKGFAVVADEVKNLAKQAADATKQISREIEAVQGISREVVTSLGNIKNGIESVSGHVQTVASAIEEQNAVTQEISRSMQSVTGAIENIGGNMDQINNVVTLATSSVASTRDASRKLAG